MGTMLALVLRRAHVLLGTAQICRVLTKANHVVISKHRVVHVLAIV